MSLTEVLRPDGAVATGLTPYPSGPNYQCVDDEVDTDFVYTSSLNYVNDIYSVGNCALASDDVIEKVTVTARLYNLSTVGHGKLALKSDGTIYLGEEVVLGAEATYTYDWTTDPATGLAWTRAAINALGIGASLKTSNGSYSSGIRWIKVTVTYSHAATPCVNVQTEVLRPSGAGDKTNLTPSSGSNYQCVDDEVDSEYVYTTNSSISIIDLYAVANSAIPGNARIHKIEVTGLLSGTSLLLIKTGGSEYASEAISNGGVQSQESYVWALNPSTGLAWTKADIDALQIGASLKNAASSAILSWIKVTVHYCVPAGGRGAQIIGPMW